MIQLTRHIGYFVINKASLTQYFGSKHSCSDISYWSFDLVTSQL